jgi:Secretion system C-terminal sorting domain
MKFQLLTVLFACTFIAAVSAQPISFEKQYGAQGTTAQLIIPYSEGGFVAEMKGAGITIARLDVEGNVIWSTTFRDSVMSLSVSSIIETREQGILVTMINSSFIYMIKLSATGTQEWTAKLNLVYPEVFSGVSVVQKEYGDIFLATTLGSMSPSIPWYHKYVMLCKLSEQGNFIWNRKLVSVSGIVKQIINIANDRLLVFSDNISTYNAIYSSLAIEFDTAANIIAKDIYRISAPALPSTYFNSVWVNDKLQPEVLIFHRPFPYNGVFLVQLDSNRQVIRTDSINPQTFTNSNGKVLAKTDSAYIIGSSSYNDGAEFLEWPFNGGMARGLKITNVNGHYFDFSRTPDGSLFLYGYSCQNSSQNCRVNLLKSDIATIGNLPTTGCNMQPYQTIVEPAITDVIPVPIFTGTVNYPLAFSHPVYVQLTYTVSPTVNCLTVGRPEAEIMSSTLAVSPNPAIDFAILTGEFIEGDLVIDYFSVDGKLVKSETHLQCQMQANLSTQGLATGTYFLRIVNRSQNKTAHSRLIVCHN